MNRICRASRGLASRQPNLSEAVPTGTASLLCAGRAHLIMREMENLAKDAGFEIADHLTRNHLGNPDYRAEAWEPRGWIVLRKP